MKENFTFQQKTKLLTKLFDAGCNTEKKLQQLDMESILKIPGITIPDMSLIIELQKQTKANKLFSFLGGALMSRQEQNDRHIIWSDLNLDLDDWRESLEELYPDYPEDELYDIMVKSNAENLYDERVNLDIQLSQPIIVIGDLGRWNGRVSGYKMIDSGNIKDCLYSDTDYTEWYVDRYGDLRADAVHHDGTNHYLYRVFKDGVTDTQIENLQDKIYNGKATRADITRVTKRLGDDIAGVYGFSIPKQRQPNEQAR